MTVPPRLLNALRRVLCLAAFSVPLVLAAHAVAFWGRGIIDKEALSFVVNYLADRPLVALVFHPALNDWGMYQARELSYLFDFIDARAFAALLDRRLLLFTPVSGVAGLLGVCALYLWGARRVLNLDGVTASLLLSLFLSSVVVQASTPIFYRSSKIALSVFLLAFLFMVVSLLAPGGGAGRRERRRLVALGALGVCMSLCDRQGFFFLAASTATVAALWVAARARGRRSRFPHLGVVVAATCALGVSALYNNAGGPWIIHAANGYWPDFSYQRLPAEFDARELAGNAWKMLRTQVSLFFGNLPFLPVAIGLAAALAFRARRLRSVDTVIVGAITAASAFALLAVMILRHPPVSHLRDHSYWYYPLTIHVVLLFVVTLWVAGLDLFRRRVAKAVLCAVLLALIAGNVSQYSRQREFLSGSPGWLRNQYLRSARIVNDFEVMQGRQPAGDRSPASWLRMEAGGATVELPLGQLGFLDSVQAAYATLEHRAPLADAGGPFWRMLGAFLEAPGSPLKDPLEFGSVVRGFQSIGVRRVILNRDGFQDRALGSAFVEAALTSTAPVRRVIDDDRAAIFELTNDPSPPVDLRGARRVWPRSFTITASHAAARVAMLVDRNPGTRWLTGRNQQGDEWIRIAFDAPRDIACVRLETSDRSFGDYPRGLALTSEDGGDATVLFSGSALGPLMKGLLRDPARAPIDVALPPNRTRILTVRQTGKASPWYWSVHEILVWERR